MKLFNSLCTLALASALILTSCKKEDTAQDQGNTAELAKGQAQAESFTEDDNAIFFEATAEKNLQGNSFVAGVDSGYFTSCANITVTPASGFPRTIVLDFGTGCTVQNITRSGKVNIVISDSIRKPNSTSTITFTNYFVNGYKREGTITYKNVSTPGVRSWERKVVDGKITAPNNGGFFIHNSTHVVTQTAGANTPIVYFDDVFSISGSGSVTNAAGNTATSIITSPIIKRAICPWIVQGTKQITLPNHTAIIDFGGGNCDNTATVAIDGGAPITIVLN